MRFLFERCPLKIPFKFFSIVLFDVFFAHYASPAWGSCPIESRMDPKLSILTNAVLARYAPQASDPAQISGVTLTDFDSVKPWVVQRCGERFCAKPKKEVLTHTIYVRAEKLSDGSLSPRWLDPAQFPCGKVPHKNFVTHHCTVEHEKVHVVLREEALKEQCGNFVSALASISAVSSDEAEKQARVSYVKLIQEIGSADQEELPYKIEWECNKDLAEKAGKVCPARPDWAKNPLLQKLERKDRSESLLEWYEGETLRFRASYLNDAARLESVGPVQGCKKMQWYFAGPLLDQENCFLDNGAIQKTFYEFGKKQRKILVDPKGVKASEEIYFDPRDRITKD